MIQERLSFLRCFSIPLIFRKTKTLYNMFEYDDNQLIQQSYSRFSGWYKRGKYVIQIIMINQSPLFICKKSFERWTFDEKNFFVLFWNPLFRGGLRPRSLSYLGKPRLFTTCSNTMITNWSNKVIRGFLDDTREAVFSAMLFDTSHI